MIQLLALATFHARQDVRFAFSGPMSSLLAEGKKPGFSTSGEPVQIVLTDGGAKIQATEFEVKVPGSDKTVKLSLANAKFADGHLTATVTVDDTSATSIEGVRLDLRDATETYKAGDGSLKERSQPVSIASPLFFGDLGPGETSNGLSLDASTIAFKPETTRIEVNASLSGLRYVATLHFGSDCSDDGELDVNAKGQVFTNNLGGGTVMRMESDGTHSATVTKLPDQTKGMAVSPTTGDIAANCANNYKIFLFSASGDDKGTISGDDNIPGWPSLQRYDSKGRLWSTCGAAMVRYGADGKIAEKIEKLGDYDLDEASPFDVAPDGSIVAVSAQTLFRLSPDHKTAKRIALNGVEHLGQVIDPKGCRFDAAGNIYVTEFGDNTPTNPARVSVFDRNGDLVRVFGRGAKSPKADYPDARWDAEIVNPADIAFGPDGKVFLSFGGDQGAVMVFQPF